MPVNACCKTRKSPKYSDILLMYLLHLATCSLPKYVRSTSLFGRKFALHFNLTSNSLQLRTCKLPPPTSHLSPPPTSHLPPPTSATTYLAPTLLHHQPSPWTCHGCCMLRRMLIPPLQSIPPTNPPTHYL